MPPPMSTHNEASASRANGSVTSDLPILPSRLRRSITTATAFTWG